MDGARVNGRRQKRVDHRRTHRASVWSHRRPAVICPKKSLGGALHQRADMNASSREMTVRPDFCVAHFVSPKRRGIAWIGRIRWKNSRVLTKRYAFASKGWKSSGSGLPRWTPVGGIGKILNIFMRTWLQACMRLKDFAT